MLIPKINVILLAILMFWQNAGFAQKTNYINQPNASVKKPEYTIVTVNDTTFKGWEHFAKGDIVDNSLVADSKGTIYCIMGKNYKPKSTHRVGKLVDKSWVDIQGDIDESISRIWLTKNDQLVLETQTEFYLLTNNGWEKTDKKIKSEKFERLIPGAFWKDYPPFPVIGKYPSLQRSPSGQVYFTIEQDGLERIYKLINDSWVFLAKGTTIYFSTAIAVNSKLYRTGYLEPKGGRWKEECLMVFNDSMTVTTKTEKIFSITKISLGKFMNLDSSENKFAAYRNHVGIFEVNGKKGLRSIYGDTLVYPVFQSITLEWGYSALPSRDNGAISILHLVGKNMDFKADNTKNPNILIGFIDSVRKCRVCNGRGRLEDKVEKSKEKEEIKEWIPEKKEFVQTGTSTGASGRYNPSTRRYEAVKMGYEKVTPGHWKHIGWKQKEDKITYGKDCTECNSGKKKHFTTRKEYHFDKATNSYLVKIINESFE